MDYALFVVASVSFMAALGLAWRYAKRVHRKGISPILED